MKRQLLAIITLLCASAYAFDFFDFFGGEHGDEHQFFGGGQGGPGGGQHHHYKQSQTRQRPVQKEVECFKFYCAETKTCVDKPIDCPCFNPQEIKCQIGEGEDAWYLCIRPDTKCETFGLKAFK